MVYSTIREIQQYQNQCYSFQMIDGIAHYLSEMPMNDEESLFELSLLREPRKVESASELL